MKRGYISIITAFCVTLATFAQTGDWNGKLDVMGTTITMVFHISDEKCSLDVPEQGANNIPVEATITPPVGVKLEIPIIGASYEGIFLGYQILGTFSQFGQSFPLTLKPGAPMLKRPQTPQPPFPYTTKEVTFTNGDATLKGTLTIPEECSKNTPVVVLITGSGLQNRDEEIHQHKPFAVIADAMARAGIATMRYDDRGFGESTGNIVNATTEDFKNDALAGIELMRQQFNKVGVLGHSEGGTIAMMLAAEKKTDFIVSLAGGIISSKETLLWQNRQLLSAAGYSDAIVNEYCLALTDIYNAITAGTNPPSTDIYNLPTELKTNLGAVVEQCSTPYMQYFLQLDITKSLKKISCPVMALNGTKDTQVWCESNLSALHNGLPATKGNNIRAVEGINHLFQHCQSGLPSEYLTIEETISPEVLQDIIEWIKNI